MCATPSGPPPRFLCDQNLGRLARWLRILGFDAAYMKPDSDGKIREAEASGRIVLTRKTSICRGRSAHLIVHDRVQDQLRQLGCVYDLSQGEGALSRCSLCNVPLEETGREEVKGRVPDYVHATRDTFARCPSCRRIYWKGTHYARICDRMRSILKGCRT